jgi:hypothetical protein
MMDAGAWRLLDSQHLDLKNQSRIWADNMTSTT